MSVNDFNMTIATNRGMDRSTGWDKWESYFELSCKAVPIEQFLEVLNFLPYAHPVRVYIQFLFLTGCRTSEADKAEMNGADSFIKGNYFYWRVGKNQKGQWRREELSSVFLDELNIYRGGVRGYGNLVFHAKSKTLTRYFNVYVRPHLGLMWQERVTNRGLNNRHEHVLQMKGFRKTFATLVFWHYWKEFDDSSVGMHMACKRMRHSHTGMTVTHYIEQGDRLQPEKWKGWTPTMIVRLATQRNLPDFDNSQRSMQEWF